MVEQQREQMISTQEMLRKTDDDILRSQDKSKEWYEQFMKSAYQQNQGIF